MAEKKEEETSNFGEWCQMTGWHGILDFYNAKHLTWKVIWILVVLVGCFFAVVQGGNMVIDFLSDDEWVTTINYEAPKKGCLEWPNITICGLSMPPIGGVNEISMPSLGEEYERYEHIFDDGDGNQLDISTVATNTGTEDTATAVDDSEAAAEADDMSLESGTTSDQDLEPSKVCPRVMVSCGTIDGRGYGEGEHYEKCCNGSLENPNTKVLKRCFTLKTDAIVRAHKDHSVHRIYYLVMPTIAAKKNGTHPFADAGLEIRLYLGYSDTVDDFSSTFYVMPGTRNVISMISEVYRTKQRERLMSFSNVDLPCSQHGSYSFLTETTYTKDLCAADCRIKWQRKYCGCYTDDYSMIGLKGGLKLCNETAPNQDEISVSELCAADYTSISLMAQSTSEEAKQEAQQSLLNSYNESYLNEAIEDTKCVCPEPCEYGRIEAKISSSLFVGPFWAEDLRNKHSFFNSQNYTPEDVRSVTMLEMYHEIKQLRVIEKKPRISLDEFISNLGGCLGVWSGISFLSVVQIFFYLIRAVVHCLMGPKPKSTRQVIPVYPPVSVKNVDLAYCIS